MCIFPIQCIFNALCIHVLISLELSILSILELSQESLILVTIITAGRICGFVLCEKKSRQCLRMCVLSLIIGSRPESVSMSEYSTLSQTGRRYYRSNRNVAAPVETLTDGRASMSNGKRKSHRDPRASPA